MTALSLEGPTRLTITAALGGTSIERYLKRELRAMAHVAEANGTERAPTVRLECSGHVTHHPERVYGASGGLDGDRFVVPDGAGHWCSFDPAELRVAPGLDVAVDLCCQKFKANVLLDWILLPIAQFGAAAMGVAPIHASGAHEDGHRGPVVFSAWSGVGKTNLVLQALAKGARYYGDDRVYITAEGTAIASGRRVSIYGYNRKLAHGLGFRGRVALALADYAHRTSRRVGGRLGFLLSYLANGLATARMSSQELGGASPLELNAAVALHCICTAVSGISQPAVSTPRASSAPRTLATAHRAVMQYEYVWFQRYIQTWMWSHATQHDPWQDLADAWDAVLERYFACVPICRVQVPVGNAVENASELWSQVHDLFSHMSRSEDMGAHRTRATD